MGELAVTFKATVPKRNYPPIPHPHLKEILSKMNFFTSKLSPKIFNSPVSVEESNQFGCFGFSCADLSYKFKLQAIERV